MSKFSLQAVRLACERSGISPPPPYGDETTEIADEPSATFFVRIISLKKEAPF